ncbi:MAG: hypothetical protein AB1710_00510 [Pseudomonadota bacterium]|jgi:hypothetical protein
MSTSETVTFNKGPCPCGDGHIAQHVTTQDNPWSSADISYSIECPKCLREWRIDHTTLVLRSSELPYASASAAEEAARRTLQALALSMVVEHFSAFSAPSKKAEHAELERLGLTSMSYRQYLEHVRNGGKIASAAAPLRNQRWLNEVAKQQGEGIAEQLDTLIEAHAQAAKAREHVSKQIIRKKIA